MHYPLESSIDKSPCLNITGDGLVSATKNDEPDNNASMSSPDALENHNLKSDENDALTRGQNEDKTELNSAQVNETTPSSQKSGDEDGVSRIFSDMAGQVKRSMNQLSRQNGRSLWLLTYIAIVTTWPLLGSFLRFFSRKKLKGVSLAALSK